MTQRKYVQIIMDLQIMLMMLPVKHPDTEPAIYDLLTNLDLNNGDELSTIDIILTELTTIAEAKDEFEMCGELKKIKETLYD